jgi:hypothetical protein
MILGSQLSGIYIRLVQMPVLATVVLKKSKHKKGMDAQNKKLFYQV